MSRKLESYHIWIEFFSLRSCLWRDIGCYGFFWWYNSGKEKKPLIGKNVWYVYLYMYHCSIIWDWFLTIWYFFRIKCSNLIFFDIQMILEPKIFCQEEKKSINALMDLNIFIQESKILFFDLLWYRFHWRIPIWKIQIQMDSDAIYVEKTISESIWKIQIQMDSDAIYEEKTISESIWKIQIQMDSDAIYVEKIISKSIWKIQIQMDSDNHFLIFQFLNHTVDGKNPAPLVVPETFFYRAEKWFSGIVGGARFFPSTVLKKKIFKEIKKDLYGSIFSINTFNERKFAEENSSSLSIRFYSSTILWK